MNQAACVALIIGAALVLAGLANGGIYVAFPIPNSVPAMTGVLRINRFTGEVAVCGPKIGCRPMTDFPLEGK